MRFPENSERAEITTAGAKYTDLDGMSQMTFHTHSQFGNREDDGQGNPHIDDGASSRGSGTQTVFTKPFTV